MRRAALAAAAATLASTLWGCASSSSAPASKAPPSGPRAPYDAPAAAAHQVDITIRSRAAREILASLSRPKLEATDMKLLEDLPAVRFAIQDSNRGVEVFERDFAAAFDEKTRTAVFDFRSIRESKDRWQALLDAVEPREADLARMASTRAAALLPDDRPISARLDVFLSFGVAGLGDHIVLKGDNGREAMVLDLARALGDSEGEPLESRMSRIARVIAGEAFRQAWAVYRAQNPAWQHPDPQLGQLDVLLRAVAEAGPVAVYTVDENFFPLSTWLKEPMKRAIEDLNRRADRLAEAEGNLERRMELTGEIRRGDFSRRIAGQDGAYLVDSVIQHVGLAGLRQALQAGPRALFDAYDKAVQADKALVPLSKAIRDRLAGAPAKPAPAR
ncbi:MAG: hypothetical protein ABJC61_05615 [Acidobacteriota bacterium]